ncbi:bifunctional oligoribonuclease/PAP phosphatase NrnA [Bacteriovorax sp. Seq25_V]|uniref:DHH family phosphoesterase n=1 Tax=Bacteriovorax sp. Seq25_V TaxID=1201288 RepID=UPI00038A4416|nr:bifunctional oligoribonuclease/PAP phosphatase NrnA [Bacteriovorax sp. Seq25_V]EQC47605.1 DHH family protein [Bacteriovorax sp. Seq25_V]
MSNAVKRFLELTAKANKIVITTHIHPDADGIGSEIALCMALKKLGKDVVCVNEEPLFERYKYLDPEDVVRSYDEVKDSIGKIDLFIVTDTNSLPRIGKNVQEFVMKSHELLFIDHHPCPKELSAIHCIDSKKAATGELVGELITALGVKFDEAMALALYTSIIIDTSSFRYPTVTGNTHRVIADLLDSGVSPPQAYNMINGTKKVPYMKLLGTVLTSAQTTDDESIAWISLTEDQLDLYKSDAEDTHGFINHLLILDNIKVACMFRQIGDKVKVSFRSAISSVDVGIMAQALGGGGHNHSAATVIDGKLENVIPHTIKKVQAMLSDDE